MQMYFKKGKEVIKRRFKKKRFVNKGKYYEIMNNRPRVKELRGLKEVWQRQKEDKKKRGGKTV